ncbi:hypothetical protein J6590_027050 [Homalodisca vitripennis]|nr:hypothetical protein J6590_027050 [Homalodisca vitripennis]
MEVSTTSKHAGFYSNQRTVARAGWYYDMLRPCSTIPCGNIRQPATISVARGGQMWRMIDRQGEGPLYPVGQPRTQCHSVLGIIPGWSARAPLLPYWSRRTRRHCLIEGDATPSTRVMSLPATAS